jgi:fructose-1,6-bisphosphatase/inositol monophosphatase family enzyme
LSSDIESLLPLIKQLHEQIRNQVVEACEQTSLEELSRVAEEGEGDTIYAVDRVGEQLLVGYFEREVAQTAPLVLIAEGLPGGQVLLPRGVSERDAVWRILVDPIDGTRSLMYQKRSAWILTGVAPNRGGDTNLQDIELAVQTEIPLIKQHLSDVIWAIKGKGTEAERYNRLTGERSALHIQPSTARTIAHGFSTMVRFFPGARELLAKMDDEIIESVLGPVQYGKAQCFEDQYVSTGGQLYALMAGHDRFIADLRPLLEPALQKRGAALGICCHPYDLCTELIARELGVIVTDASGEHLRAPMNIDADVAWVGYANAQIRSQMEPFLRAAIQKYLA